jgi:DNA-directed RNA polymerase specialized sigma24 family protein
MLTAVIGVAGVCAAIVLALRLRHLQQQIKNHRVSETAAPVQPEDLPDFQTPLLQATLRQRLQQSQPQRPTPDKYKLAAEMAAQGMPAQQIADLLTLPPAEVRQLISLSRASRPGIVAPFAMVASGCCTSGVRD